MARIKKVILPLGNKNLINSNKFDWAFWEQFAKLEREAQKKLNVNKRRTKERLVTVTIKDQETGEEWVIERVRLTRSKIVTRD